MSINRGNSLLYPPFIIAITDIFNDFTFYSPLILFTILDEYNVLGVLVLVVTVHIPLKEVQLLYVFFF